MDLELGQRKHLVVDTTTNSYNNIILKGDEKNIQLNTIQAKMLVDTLQTVDSEAERVWSSLNSEEKREHRVHLGYGVYLIVSVFKNRSYYDIRRWWIPPNCTVPVPTKTGITLNADQCMVLRDARLDILQVVPEMEGIGPCECWMSNENGFMHCKRCNPWNIW